MTSLGRFQSAFVSEFGHLVPIATFVGDFIQPSFVWGFRGAFGPFWAHLGWQSQKWILHFGTTILPHTFLQLARQVSVGIRVQMVQIACQVSCGTFLQDACFVPCYDLFTRCYRHLVQVTAICHTFLQLARQVSVGTHFSPFGDKFHVGPSFKMRVSCQLVPSHEWLCHLPILVPFRPFWCHFAHFGADFMSDLAILVPFGDIHLRCSYYLRPRCVFRHKLFPLTRCYRHLVQFVHKLTQPSMLKFRPAEKFTNSSSLLVLDFVRPR